jgi:hypothetical protein
LALREDIDLGWAFVGERTPNLAYDPGECVLKVAVEGIVQLRISMLNALQSMTGGQGAYDTHPEVDTRNEEEPHTTNLADLEDTEVSKGPASVKDTLPRSQQNFLEGLEYYSTQNIIFSSQLPAPTTDTEANAAKELCELHVLRPIEATSLPDGKNFCRDPKLSLGLSSPGKGAAMSPIRKLDLNLTAKKTASPGSGPRDKASVPLTPGSGPSNRASVLLTPGSGPSTARVDSCGERDMELDTRTPSQEQVRVGDEPEEQLSSADR